MTDQKLLDLLDALFTELKRRERVYGSEEKPWAGICDDFQDVRTEIESLIPEPS